MLVKGHRYGGQRGCGVKIFPAYMSCIGGGLLSPFVKRWCGVGTRTRCTNGVGYCSSGAAGQCESTAQSCNCPLSGQRSEWRWQGGEWRRGADGGYAAKSSLWPTPCVPPPCVPPSCLAPADHPGRAKSACSCGIPTLWDPDSMGSRLYGMPPRPSSRTVSCSPDVPVAPLAL